MSIGRFIYSTISPKNKVEKHQQIIRDTEWFEIKKYIPRESKFLDVGCGAGYSLMRASQDLNCEVEGIDADPGSHGVGRFIEDMVKNCSIDFIEVEAGINSMNDWHVNLTEFKSFFEQYDYHIFGIYDQIHDFIIKKSILRRTNILFISPTMSKF